MSIVKLRKKPIEVDAVQWTGGNEAEVTAFTGTACFNALDEEDREHADDPDWTAQVFDELHGTWVGVYTGQWIIRGVKGEYYPIAEDVLRETYEDVSPFAKGGVVTVEVAVPAILTEETLRKAVRESIERSGQWPL